MNIKQEMRNQVSQFRNQVSQFRKEIIFVKDKKCSICDFDYAEILEVHHINPIAYGGDNDLNNLAALCPTCHKLVHYMTTQKYLDSDTACDELDKWIDNNLPKNKKTKLFNLVLSASGISIGR